MGLFDNVGSDSTGYALAGLGSALIGYAANQDSSNKSIEAVREQNRGNMELARYQYEKNIEGWNMQNEYNSPASQMARFKAAGLNPNLIYGSGSGNSGNATSAPQYTAPRLAAYTDFSGQASALSGFMDQALKAAQIYKSEQETSNLAQYQINMVTENDLKKLEIILKGYEVAKTETQKKFWLDTFTNELGLLKANRKLTENKAYGVSLENDLTERFGAKLKQANLDLLAEQKLHSEADRVLMRYKAAELAAEVGLKQATANRILAMTDLEVIGMKLSNGIKGIEFFVKKHAREWGINPDNNSEVGTAANFLVALYHKLKNKINGM